MVGRKFRQTRICKKIVIEIWTKKGKKAPAVKSYWYYAYILGLFPEKNAPKGRSAKLNKGPK